MSQFTLRMGDLLHFHPFASWQARRKTMRDELARAEPGESCSSTRADDLAFFSLSDHGGAENSRVALERLGLIRYAAPRQPEDDEPWPLILM
jgi:hypothetical protein